MSTHPPASTYETCLLAFGEGADARDPIERLIASAQRHGDMGDPDHEVGDLQDLLRPMWDLLTPQ